MAHLMPRSHRKTTAVQEGGKNVKFTISLEPKSRRALELASAKNRRSISGEIDMLVERLLEQNPDIADQIRKEADLLNEAA